MFPLNLLPLPGETIALHIFEERYQVLFDQLESMEIDEFGIPFVDGDRHMKLGGLMRLVFASKPDENGFRDAAVQCVGLFTIDSLTSNGTNKDSHPYPIGSVTRWTGWKNYTVSNKAADDFERAKAFSVCSNTESSNATSAVGGLIKALIEHQINPQKRFDILNSLDEATRNERIENTARFTFLIAEQEAQRNKGYFPN
jgi:hypothetical protein